MCRCRARPARPLSRRGQRARPRGWARAGSGAYACFLSAPRYVLPLRKPPPQIARTVVRKCPPAGASWPTSLVVQGHPSPVDRRTSARRTARADRRAPGREPMGGPSWLVDGNRRIFVLRSTPYKGALGGLRNYWICVTRQVPECWGEREMTTDSGGRILVVDGDEGFRKYVCELFESIGYRTRQLTSGAAVLPTVADERPAAILLDVQLPDLNGYEVCRELRNRYGDSIAIVFISGERTEALDRAGGLLLGADDYLIKPVDSGELIARVRRLVDSPRSNGQPASSNEKLESLTQREHEVLDLLAEGLRQEEIASRLVISPKTVATHIQRILGKLEVRSRAEAVSVVLREDRDVSRHDANAPLDALG